MGGPGRKVGTACSQPFSVKATLLVIFGKCRVGGNFHWGCRASAPQPVSSTLPCTRAAGSRAVSRGARGAARASNLHASALCICPTCAYLSRLLVFVYLSDLLVFVLCGLPLDVEVRQAARLVSGRAVGRDRHGLLQGRGPRGHGALLLLLELLHLAVQLLHALAGEGRRGRRALLLAIFLFFEFRDRLARL